MLMLMLMLEIVELLVFLRNWREIVEFGFLLPFCQKMGFEIVGLLLSLRNRLEFDEFELVFSEIGSRLTNLSLSSFSFFPEIREVSFSS
ncbi:hypothetical protein TREMEDRAFT_57989 [Tremella mesenterica DSM 1558]|uniref:uncharacterized protein n=1 Tax=Tremella mesenterica (strain ATCC 24925 / CBS 8224 / DSM 1558 / NBRC 9311 / NRRL Y-6157 / RJB 2259-6 / UBC 559-6) TaxID=578456 RepID=UPI00032C8F1D|nr:uncharacterized protein TREMEDRAFT_57989 [Tremella mesenterica DSM 1558]EIW65507.1 hypothetical protein TREMEDRAFT_57989 [Tremella mesenterica DSM 1558]